MQLSDIKPYANNAKKHPDEQIRELANSIKAFGWQQPIVVDTAGIIIAGHGRWFAYSRFKDELRLPEPPIQVANLTPEQAKAYRLADNRLADTGTNLDLVVEELKTLEEPMIILTGYDIKILEPKVEPTPENGAVDTGIQRSKFKLGKLYLSVPADLVGTEVVDNLLGYWQDLTGEEAQRV